MTKKTKNGSSASSRMGRSFHSLWMYVGAVAAIVLALLLYWGNTKVELTRTDVALARLPIEFDGFTIAHLSDLHNANFGTGQERLLNRVREADADIIVITGDMIDSRHTDVERAAETLRLLSEIAPVYLVTGNHEARVPETWAQLLGAAESVGVTVLRNAYVDLEQEGSHIRIAGLDDLGFYVKELGWEIGETQLKANLYHLIDPSTATILLSHRPELYAWYAAAGTDLVLAGHAHGGQIRLPWIGGVVAPGQGLLPKYTEGVHRFENMQMVISRGLGNSILPIRVNNPPEVVAVTLHCEKDADMEVKQ